MISFIELGKFGRLGNQMFQVAATLSAAKRAGTKALFPRGSQVESVFTLEDCNFNDLISPEFAYFERSFEFDSNFTRVPDSCNLHGYFQSEKYFKDFNDDIIKNFSFRSDVRSKASQSLKSGEATCSVHVRRGDYVNLSEIHCFPGNDYYVSSMERVRSKFGNVRFLIFSDDIEWCKNSKIFEGCDFSDAGLDSVEMCMMSMCKFHIIANSSFSWWGAKLASSELTIAPSKWFGPGGPGNWRDVYCENWEVI